MDAALDMLASPIGFAEKVLGLQLYPWQDEVLSWFDDAKLRVKGTIAAPNGSGKDDRVIASLALWYLAVHPRAKVVITSRDSRQIHGQTFAALGRHAAKFEGWKWTSGVIANAAGGRIILFTTNEAGRAEGWHKEDDVCGPLLMIVNEAKSVPDEIFEAFDRCTYNGILYISSSGLMEGRFYESHTKLAGQFRRRIVRLEECPHIPKSRVDDLLRSYGREHPFVKSTLYSEFMSQDEGTQYVFSLEAVQAAIRTPPAHRRGSRAAYCDFAAGGDENVLAIRDGNRVEIVAAWRERDTMSAVGRFILEFRKAGLQAEEIYADYGGLGIPMCNRLWELGWEVNRVENGARPRDVRYRHRGAEIWHETAAAVSRGELILPDDGVLIAQLTTRKVKIESDGRLGMEPKPHMQKRGLPSPDRADAVCGACAHEGLNRSGDLFSTWENCQEEGMAGRMPGMDSGG